MTAVYVGAMTIGAAVPAADAAASGAVVGLNLALPDLEARIAQLQAAVAGLSVPLPPNLADMAVRATFNLGAVQLALATPGLPLSLPDLTAAAAALLALVGELLGTAASISAQLSLLAGFRALLATAGVHVVAYDGAIGSLGSELQSAVATPIPSGHANALALVTTSGATWSAMSQVFKVSP
jgi:hypothetical protein